MSAPAARRTAPGAAEHLEVAVRTVDGVLVLGHGELHRDLPVVLAMGDEEGDGDPLDHALQRHPRCEGHEVLEAVLAEHPLDVVPVVRHGVFALPLK